MVNKKPWVIVFGNIKGGTGKSTLAVHMSVALLYRGYTVASVDLDGRQGTFSRYLENRKAYCEAIQKPFPTPRHLRISPVLHEDFTPSREALDTYLSTCGEDIVVVDTAGNDSLLSCYAHSLADILVTPINDSFIDLDMLVNIQPSDKALPLSRYASMVWEQRMQKAAQQQGSIEWLIVRNRMYSMASKNRLHMEKILKGLSKRIGFHLVGEVGERVIFRELFDSGLTLLDKEEKLTTLSHVAARQELRILTDALIHFQNRQHRRSSL